MTTNRAIEELTNLGYKINLCGHYIWLIEGYGIKTAVGEYQLRLIAEKEETWDNGALLDNLEEELYDLNKKLDIANDEVYDIEEDIEEVRKEIKLLREHSNPITMAIGNSWGRAE